MIDNVVFLSKYKYRDCPHCGRAMLPSPPTGVVLCSWYACPGPTTAPEIEADLLTSQEHSHPPLAQPYQPWAPSRATTKPLPLEKITDEANHRQC